ncbi:MAG TPA: ATP-dependent Clp protease proteolytic subunit [Polyangiaceae bacterium]|jgi:ATP-dependent Clp protease protease subunit
MPEPKTDADDQAPPRGDAFLEHVADALFRARTVLVYGEVTTQLARGVSAQLLALAASGDGRITMIVHSQGGHVEAADTIYDLARAIAPDVVMIGTGWVASAGALIYAAAKRENRYALPNTRFLLHQPLGGMSGSASDVDIEAAQIVAMRERLNRTFATATGQSYERVVRDTQRNFWMGAKEAQGYGLVHAVVERLAEVRG